LKKIKISLVYIIFLLVVNLFHSKLKTFLFSYTGEHFVLYLIYGLFISFFLILLFKAFISKSNLNIVIELFIMGFILFHLFSTTGAHFLFKVSIFEFFILGVLLSMENKKSKSWIPFALLISAVILTQFFSDISMEGSFYYLDVWRDLLFALSGYISVGVAFYS